MVINGIKNKSKLSEYLFLIFTVFLLFALKTFYDNAPVEHLRWILSPTTLLTQATTGLDFHWMPNEGYLNRSHQILINQSCGGVNFLIIAIALSIFSFLKYFQTFRHKALGFLGLIMASYLLTLLANTSRIVISILFLPLGDKVELLKTDYFHQAIGILCFLSMLVIYYNVLKRVVRR